ncbi:sensor histidine kinase [Pseudoalteromonas ulvae]|uniref:histidine kinase n=1 Tax=Pseudoalteromonas ulvae TaxID=107327 RepID=A0A244CQX3_PSEDV|nr:HAMP domain-containing sensor histidine kinase [Pseudoalteromonas ulvae]OUL57995.1 hypothetical protein B1199_06440 [Pseudoalteromonas ulvae]
MMLPKSLEHLLVSCFVGFALIIGALLATLFYLTDTSLLLMLTIVVVVLIPMIIAATVCFRAMTKPFYNLSAMLEAIRYEDYSLRANPKFTQGAVKTLSDEVTLMALDLQARKQHYDQQAVLVLGLIEQLATPIALFDQDGRLQHANDAFSLWCHKPWRNLKSSHASQLGLTFNQQSAQLVHWTFAEPSLAAKWQLRHSQLSMQGLQYQLVVLTNIEQVVYQTEQTAWHKMTKVLSHEINNSLAPIKSLAQSLEQMLAEHEPDVLDALSVIGARSDGLMKFVNRYANLATEYDVHLTPINVEECAESVMGLFDYPIAKDIKVAWVLADKVLLEQVLVNLVKNSIEASKDRATILINAHQQGEQVVISVVDSGSGIANPDNLFVPFYTTKIQGKGIGLTLCRNMVEQQGGKLSVTNRLNTQGVIASVVLAAANRDE